METIKLTTPETVLNYSLVYLRLNFKKGKVVLMLEGENGKEVRFVFNDYTAQLNALNTANLSIKSLIKRIFEKLIEDGSLIGTIEGIPD